MIELVYKRIHIFPCEFIELIFDIWSPFVCTFLNSFLIHQPIFWIVESGVSAWIFRPVLACVICATMCALRRTYVSIHARMGMGERA